MSFRHLFIFLLAPGLVAGCSSGGTDAPVTPDTTPISTTSGSTATISDENTTIAFIPDDTEILVIPVTTAISGSGTVSSTTVTVSNNMDSCTADANAKKVFCVGYSNSTVAVLDVAGYLASGSEISVTEFDANSNGTYTFSGGDCMNCGVIADPDDSRIIVSAADGYRVFNYAGVLQGSYLSDLDATPARDLATENFGYDPVNNLILSPEYETTNNFFWVVNIDKGKIYRWSKRMVMLTTDSENGLAGLSDSGFGFTAESAALDLTTGMLAIGDEWLPRLLTINMDEAIFNDSTLTFTAPYIVSELQNVYSPGNLLTTGVAIESGNHLLLMEEEFFDSIGVAKMADTRVSGGFEVTNYNTAALPSPVDVCTTDTYWTNIGDPHGLAVFTALVDGKSWGLLINYSKTCAAVIDMAAVLNAPRRPAENIVEDGYDLIGNNIVTYISLIH